MLAHYGHMSKKTSIFWKKSRLRILSALSVLNLEKFFAHFLRRGIKFAQKEAQMTQLNGALLHLRNFSPAYAFFKIFNQKSKSHEMVDIFKNYKN